MISRFLISLIPLFIISQAIASDSLSKLDSLSISVVNRDLIKEVQYWRERCCDAIYRWGDYKEKVSQVDADTLGEDLSRLSEKLQLIQDTTRHPDLKNARRELKESLELLIQSVVYLKDALSSGDTKYLVKARESYGDFTTRQAYANKLLYAFKPKEEISLDSLLKRLVADVDHRIEQFDEILLRDDTPGYVLVRLEGLQVVSSLFSADFSRLLEKSQLIEDTTRNPGVKNALIELNTALKLLVMSAGFLKDASFSGDLEYLDKAHEYLDDFMVRYGSAMKILSMYRIPSKQELDQRVREKRELGAMSKRDSIIFEKDSLNRTKDRSKNKKRVMLPVPQSVLDSICQQEAIRRGVPVQTLFRLRSLNEYGESVTDSIRRDTKSGITMSADSVELLRQQWLDKRGLR